MSSLRSYKPVFTGYLLHQDNRKYLFVRSTFGSGKSVMGMMHLILNSKKQPPNLNGVRHSRYAVVRKTAKSITTSTLNTWLDEAWLGGILKVKNQPLRGSAILPWPDGTVSEIDFVFVGMDNEKDIGQLQSMEVTGVYLNEAHELSKNVHSMFTSRLRYPKAKTLDQIHPNFRDSYAPYLNDRGKVQAIDPFIFCDYNSIPTSHWLAELELNPDLNNNHPKFGFYVQPPAVIPVANGNVEGALGPDIEGNYYVLNPDAENLENLPSDYYQDQLYGKDPEWVKVFLMNEYGTLSEGRPVYKAYKDSVHYDKHLEPLKHVPLIIGIDPGLGGMAAAITQLSASGRLLVLDEVIAEGMSAEDFGKNLLWPHLRNFYPKHRHILVIDPSARNRSQTDYKTTLGVLKGMGFRIILAPKENNPTARQAAVNHFLLKQDGLSVGPEAPVIRQGFLGGYRYEKANKIIGSTTYKAKPDKNEHCVDLDNEILTLDGFKRYDELSVGDKVFGYDIVKNKLVKDELLNISVYDHTVQGIKLHGNEIDFFMTDNHRVPVVRRVSNVYKAPSVKFAKDLNSADHLFGSPGIYEPIKKALFTDDFITLAAWVSAEGTKRSDGSYMLCQSVTANPRYVDLLDDLANRHPEMMSRKSDTHSISKVNKIPSTVAHWRITKDWARMLDTYYTGNKVPTTEFIMQMNNKDRRRFLYEFMKADGCWQTDGTTYLPNINTFSRNRDILELKPGTPRLYSCDNDMTNALQMMAVLAGFNTSNRGTLNRDGSTRWSMNLLQNRKLTAIQNITKTNTTHKDGVWCPTTNSSFWVMRTKQSRIFITGNSHIHDALQYACQHHAGPIIAMMNKNKPKVRPNVNRPERVVGRAGY